MGITVWAEALASLLPKGAIVPEDLMDEDIKTGTAVPTALWEPVT